MPFRRKPNSDNQRTESLESAKRKLDSLPEGAENPLRASTADNLNQQLPEWKREISERDSALGEQTAATTALNESKDTLRLWVTHFLQAFQNAVARGEEGFSVGDRPRYGLGANQENLPKMGTEAELLRVADQVVKGENERVAAGGAPVTMPTIEKVAEKLADVKAKLAEQQARAASHQKEQKDVVEVREVVDELIDDIWNELEFFHVKEPDATKRRLCREWGVVYALRPGEPDEDGALPAGGGEDPAPDGGAGG